MATPFQVGRSARTITVGGGNLFAIAAEHLGDHTMWARIARLNKLRDPFLPEVMTLVLPERPAKGQQESGVIGA